MNEQQRLWMEMGAIKANQELIHNNCVKEQSVIEEIKEAVMSIPLLRKDILEIKEDLSSTKKKVENIGKKVDEQAPTIEEVKKIKSRGIKTAAYIGAVFIIIGLFSAEVRNDVFNILDKAKSYLGLLPK